MFTEMRAELQLLMTSGWKGGDNSMLVKEFIRAKTFHYGRAGSAAQYPCAPPPFLEYQDSSIVLFTH